MDLKAEFGAIAAEASRQGVDPFFVAAIRVAENGGPGREFGVLSVPAHAYGDQLREACITVRHRLIDYDADNEALTSINNRVCYSYDFVAWFAMRWAPPGAANDPGGLNRNWPADAWNAYTRFVRGGGIE